MWSGMPATNVFPVVGSEKDMNPSPPPSGFSCLGGCLPKKIFNSQNEGTAIECLTQIICEHRLE